MTAFRLRKSAVVTAEALAEAVGGSVVGDAAMTIDGVCSLDASRSGALAFVKGAAFLKGRDPTTEGVLLLVPRGEDLGLKGTVIEVDDPRLAFALVCERFFVERPQPGIDPGASIHPTAKVANSAVIGAGCVIGPDVEIGEGTELRCNVVIGPRVKIGAGCLVKSNTVIGEEGFGVVKTAEGHNMRIPHFGSVVIGDGVELGSLNTVASGTIDPTRIGDRVKTDDHVHIAHNCVIGEDTIITACAELSGSVTVGRDVWIGPNASIINGATLADGVFLGLGAVVTKSLPEKGVYAGAPARLLRKL